MVIAAKKLCLGIFLFVFFSIGFAKSQSKPVELVESDSDEDFDFDDIEAPAKLDPKLKELYLAWNNFDLCKDVQCKANEYCTSRDNIAKCIKKKKSKATQRKKSGNNVTDKRSKQDHNSRTSKACNPCPVVRPDFICGSDNSTYSSDCRLDFHNCVHSTSIQISCKGFCPCKPYRQRFDPAKQSKKLLWDSMKHKFDKTQMKASTKYAREFDKISKSPNKNVAKSEVPKHQCNADEMKTMGDRLLHWFEVLLSDPVRKKASEKNSKFKLPDCKAEIAWMFHHLDVDSDLKLTIKELYDLEHDQREKCLRQYLESCDEDKDSVINPYEWCTCFDRKSQPCFAAHTHSKKELLGAYSPQCDEHGFYKTTQCHGSSGMCWCADKNGVEFTNTRRRGGKPDCEGMLTRAKQKNTDNYNDDEDDIEASGDGQ